MKDHQKVQGMLRTVISSADSKVRKENMNQVVYELSQHAAVEEQILYPTLRHLHDDGDKMADRAIEEHLKVKKELDALDKMEVTESKFVPAVEKMSKDLDQHIKEEESEIFPILKQKLSKEDLDKMGNLLESMKTVSPTRPHPHMPATPPYNVMAGPLAAFLDRVRDLGRSFPKK
ncbi:hemerythrin hhe cation binding subfamily protein [Acanthamoeba castellanii str. Neff]|uniref:Hemerythrin hhe cation binding subfamily protein n=1 Tax=Acanthamoeba castellanii (strain ATCC 30010 / Neff) TaxID=1257118 RepID=L8H6K3_ACACF|nr:hemerythrin hhe cation binding subfamily protein [Acanthamoeba castellanii str. Neff]ELR20877.1 hemerythrin hhe cation binding subfamily protein [Acanthamoeba castellanii str. Neff]